MNKLNPEPPIPRLPALLALAALLGMTAAAFSADDELDKVLAKERWREKGYGVSLRPPLDTRLQSRNIDDAKLRIIKGDEYVISVFLKDTGQELTIDQVVRTAIEQFGFAQPSAVIDHQAVAKPAGRPGWIIYFGVNLPAKDRKPEPERDIKALTEIARTQLETANQMRATQDIAAYRLYKAIAANSPDKAIAAQARKWIASMEVDQQFIARYLKDEDARRKRNPLVVGDKAWYMGQAIMQLAPNAFVVVQLEATRDAYATARPVFESVVKSLEVMDPQELDKQRKELLKAGDTIDSMLNHKRLLEALLPEVRVPIFDKEGKPAGNAQLRLQYLRVIEGGKDIGWMKTVHRERRDEIVVIDLKNTTDPKTGRVKTERISHVREHGINGIGVDVYARIHFGPRAVDTHSQTFLSEDGNYESWSIRTTVRDRKDPHPDDPKSKPLPTKAPPRAAPKAVGTGGPGNPIVEKAPTYHVRTWLETGVQHKEQITIIRDGPTGKDRINWRKPTDGYMTQTELYLLAPLLPRKDAEYGFYAYYPNTGNISFRTLHVVPDGNGADSGFRIRSRAALDAPEQVSEYDAKGGLITRSLGEGREVVPTTREELANIWNVELPDDTAAPEKPEDDKPLPPTGRIPR